MEGFHGAWGVCFVSQQRKRLRGKFIDRDSHWYTC